MKKKKGKLNLGQLKVKSFVTDEESGKVYTAKGGARSLVGCITKPSMCIFTACDCPTNVPWQCLTQVRTNVCCIAP